ncbi:MAG: GHKL domain-containing protein [Clostridiales bacterium]
MNVITFILFLIFFMIFGFIMSALVQCFVPIKDKLIWKSLSFVALAFIVAVVIFAEDIVNVSYGFIGFILIMLLCFQGKVINRISVVMVLYPIVISWNFFMSQSRWLFYLLYQNIPMNTLVRSYVILSEDIIINLLTALLWFAIYKIAKNKIENLMCYINTKTWILIDAICCAPLVAIISTIIFTPSTKDFQVYPVALACLVTSIGMLFLIEYFLNSVKLDMENKNLKLQYNYYKELEKNQNQISKLCHDMNNRLGVIAMLMETGDKEKTKEYFESLISKTQSISRAFCQNSIVNAVLNNKYNAATDRNINCFFNIDISQMLSIDDVDLCTLFANTLDNAIEAAVKTDAKKIEVKARCHKGYFTYSVVNSKANVVNEVNGVFSTHKDDKKIHGFGIESVKDIVKKYNGSIDISYDATTFSVIIIIKIQ